MNEDTSEGAEFAEDEPKDLVAPTTTGVQLVLDIDGFEGPLDVLLMLARNQKVDLKNISILALADQYLSFIQEARDLNLDLAADYLVMAAWLAYLKSRLLLPSEEDGEEPSGEELAARLAFQLRRLEAMREASDRLMTRNRLGRDIFARGQPEGIRVIRHSSYELPLYDLLRAYADHNRRNNAESLRIHRPPLYSIDQALQQINRLLGTTVNWAQLESFLPPDVLGGDIARSAVASTFVAGLELARQGELQLRQLKPFGPIYFRKTPDSARP